jgi:hypothetical protein
VQVLYEAVFSIGFVHPSIECAFTAEAIKQIAAQFEEINQVKTGEPADEQERVNMYRELFKIKTVAEVQ